METDDRTNADNNSPQGHEQLISDLGFLIAQYWLDHYAVRNPTDQSEQEEDRSLSDDNRYGG